MFSSPSLRRTGLRLGCAVGLTFVACSSQPRQGAERIAVLSLENLSGDASLDWMGHAVADVISQRLIGCPSIHATRRRTLNEAVGWRATKMLAGYFTISGESLDVRMSLRSLRLGRAERHLRQARPVAELIDLAGDIAADVGGPDVRPYGTASLSALQAYSEATMKLDPGDMEDGLRAAIESDPGYGQAIVALAQVAALREDWDSIKSLLDQPRELQPIDQARLAVLEANKSGDSEALLAANQRLAALTPADSDLLQRIANSYLASHDYASAIQWYRDATRVEPARTSYWNSLGYAQAWNRDLTAARASLQQYRQLDPTDTNGLDSLGEVHFHLGHMEEAARYFLECYDADHLFRGGVALRKAALARFLSGDRDGAEALAEQFFNEREPTGVLDFQRIRWRYLIGEHAAATEEMLGLATGEETPPALASAAYSVLSVWSVTAGDRAQAAHHARRANELAQNNPRAVTWARLVSFLAEPSASPPEWEQRAAEAFPTEAPAALRTNALATGLLLDGHFAEAAPLLEEIATGAPPFNEDEAGVLLAWALIETGRTDEARPLTEVFPVIQPGQESLIYSLSFPRILELRPRVAIGPS